MIWKIKNKSLECSSWKPLVMGILNVTPDSFSDGGRYLEGEKAVEYALLMESEGADIIDIGGESTRPNAEEVSAEEELARVIPVIERLHGRLSIPISIDTTKSAVAREAIQAGAEIVNDVSAGEWDPDLIRTVMESEVGYILMHSQGNPRTMQTDPRYEDVTEEVFLFLKKNLERVVSAGLSLESVVVDMGFGFGKTMEHNLTLLKNVERFKELNRPILLGLSRKSFLRNLVSAGNVETATVAAQILGTLQGGSIWRTHDVVQAVASRRVLEEVL